MAYQPLQLPTVAPMESALSALTAMVNSRRARNYQDQQLALEREAQRQRQANADRQFELNQRAQERQDERLDMESARQAQLFARQTAGDRMAVLEKAAKLRDSGLPMQAEQLLKVHGISLTPEGTVSDPFAPPNQVQPQGGSPTPDNIEFGQPQQSTTGPVPQDVYDQTVTFANKTQNPETHALNEWYQPGGPPPIAAPTAPQQPQAPMSVMDAIKSGNLDNLPQSPAVEPAPMGAPNPLIAARQRGLAQDAQRAQLLRAKGPNGEDLGIINPNERVEANAAKSAIFDQAFGGVPNAETLRPFFVAAIESGMEPADAIKSMVGMMNAQATREHQDVLKKQYGTTFDQKKELARMQGQNRIAVAEISDPYKAERANTVASGAVRQRYDEWYKTNDWNTLQKNARVYNGLVKNLGKGTEALQHRDAQVQLGKIMRGSTPTEGEMHLLYGALGGTSDKWNQWIATLENGDLSAEQLRQLKAATAAVGDELNDKIENAYQSALVMLGPGSGLDIAGSNVNKMIQGAFKGLGRTVRPLYEDAGPGIQTGSGVAPWRLKQAAEKGKKVERKQADTLKNGGEPVSPALSRLLEGGE